MIQHEIQNRLRTLQDIPFRDFQRRLIPTAEADRIIGVRTPALRELAKEIAKRGDVGEFLGELPHRTFEENQLHAFIISLTKDYDRCMEQVQAFLPYVDNWATCDQMSPKVFRKHRDALRGTIAVWLQSSEVYTVRFGVKMLMEHFLDDAFDEAYPRMAAQLRSDEYYVNMMIAWYFATALAKQYEAVLPLIESRALDAWTHNKAIQKALESNRVIPEHKAYLRTLKEKPTR